MEKSEFVALAKNLMMEALYARAYKAILDQYRDSRMNNHGAIAVSSVFYSISEAALIEALSIRLARLFDYDDKSANIKLLMSEAEASIGFFPKKRTYEVTENGEKKEIDFSLSHTLRESEKCYFKEKVEKEESIQRFVTSITGVEQQEMTIDVTIEELFGMYRKRFHSLEPIRKNLIEQRKKIYAHNDKEVNFKADSIYKKNPLSYSDIDRLIEFASDYISFCYEYTSGKYASIHIEDIDDLKYTLNYVEKEIGKPDYVLI